jgi:hypothetical protein
LSLADAALELARDNFGEMTRHLADALSSSDEALYVNYFDDLLRLFRLAERQGYGERLIRWFGASGQDVHHAPVYAALVAFVRGEQALLDVNPEVRRPAERIYQWLTSSGRTDREASAAKPKRRGRPRKRRA